MNLIRYLRRAPSVTEVEILEVLHEDGTQCPHFPDEAHIMSKRTISLDESHYQSLMESVRAVTALAESIACEDGEYPFDYIDFVTHEAEQLSYATQVALRGLTVAVVVDGSTAGYNAARAVTQKADEMGWLFLRYDVNRNVEHVTPDEVSGEGRYLLVTP